MAIKSDYSPKIHTCSFPVFHSRFAQEEKFSEEERVPF